MQHTEIKLNSKEIFKGNVFRVTMDQVELENGMTSFREVVHHNGGACILPLTDDDKVLMVRQYRYALKEELWELPAGKLEKDEDPFSDVQFQNSYRIEVYNDYNNFSNHQQNSCHVPKIEPDH